MQILISIKVVMYFKLILISSYPGAWNQIEIESSLLISHFPKIHCVKSVRIGNYSGPYSVRMWEITDHNNSKYERFSRSAIFKRNTQCFKFKC